MNAVTKPKERSVKQMWHFAEVDYSITLFYNLRVILILIACQTVFCEHYVTFLGEHWLQWTTWSAQCEPECWNGKGKHNKFPHKTRSRTSLNDIIETETQECDWKVCQPGKRYA